MPHTPQHRQTRQERNRLAEEGRGGIENAVRIAQVFSQISREAARAANQRRQAVAGRNVEIGTAMLELAETEERKQITQALARHTGILRVNAAYRGTAGGRSTLAQEAGAQAQATQSAAVVSANTAFRVQQLINDNVVDLEDENMAALEGGLRGFSIGQQVQGALDSLARERTTRNGSTVFETPGLDLGALFAGGGDFESLLRL